MSLCVYVFMYICMCDWYVRKCLYCVHACVDIPFFISLFSFSSIQIILCVSCEHFHYFLKILFPQRAVRSRTSFFLSLRYHANAYLCLCVIFLLSLLSFDFVHSTAVSTFIFIATSSMIYSNAFRECLIATFPILCFFPYRL